MTSRERICCALRLGRPDRVPVSPFVGPGWFDQAGEVGQAVLREADPLVDVGLGGGDFFLGLAAEVATVEEGNQRRTTVHTPRGPLTSTVTRTERTSAQTEFFFKAPEDIERFLSIPYVAPEPDPTRFLEWKHKLGEEGLVLAGMGDGVCLPASYASPEHFCLLWADAPDLLERLVSIGTDRACAWVAQAAARGVDAFRLVGGEYVSVQLGPRAFARLVVPYDRALVEIIHRGGAIAYYHNHGKIGPVMEQLAAIGMDALDPVEGPPCGDVELDQVKQAIGDRACLVGNLDDMMVLSQVSEQEAAARGQRCLEMAGPAGYLLGGTASGLYTERMARNFLALARMPR